MCKKIFAFSLMYSLTTAEARPIPCAAPVIRITLPTKRFPEQAAILFVCGNRARGAWLTCTHGYTAHAHYRVAMVSDTPVRLFKTCRGPGSQADAAELLVKQSPAASTGAFGDKTWSMESHQVGCLQGRSALVCVFNTALCVFIGKVQVQLGMAGRSCWWVC